MSASRETDDPDTLGITTPGLGFRADDTNRALCIEQGNKLTSAWQTVFEHDPGDTMRVEPLRNSVTLRSGHQPPVSTTRTDDCRGSVRLGRAMDGDDRLG